MAIKKEVKNLEEARKVLDKVVKNEKLSNYPIIDNNKKQNKHTN